MTSESFKRLEAVKNAIKPTLPFIRLTQSPLPGPRKYVCIYTQLTLTTCAGVHIKPRKIEFMIRLSNHYSTQDIEGGKTKKALNHIAIKTD